MRYSTAFLKTLREKPRNADNTAHELLIRAGYLRPSAAGLIAITALGARVLDRLNARVVDAFRAVAAESWVTPPPFPGTTRERPPHSDLKRALKDARAKPRNQFFLAECHEGQLCALAGTLNASYKDLPATLQFITWAQRDSARSSTSLLWPRLFPMASAVVLAPDEAVLAERGEALAQACGVILQDVPVVTLDAAGCSGAAPGWLEFAVLNDAGDEDILLCGGGCGYAAGADRAVSVFPPYSQDETPAATQSILGENIVSTAELARFAGIDHQKTTKTLIFESDGRPVAVAVRGEYDVSETKVAGLLGCSDMRLASAELIQELTGAEVGYAGPVGLPDKVAVLWDHSTAGRVNFEAGANKTHYHLLNLNFGRDVTAPEKFHEVRRAREGEPCGRCRQQPLERKRALKIAHVSLPGTLYSEALGASFAAKDGKPHPMLLACCGVDLFRLLAAIVEQNHDERGIAWPAAIAPFDVHLVSLPGVEAKAAALYERLQSAGTEVLWDDRAAPAGAKFADADLIGIPARIVISPRTGECVEWKSRRAAAAELITLDEAVSRLT